MKQLVTIIFFISHIFLGIYGSNLQNHAQRDESIMHFDKSKICTTDSCKETAKRILDYMNDEEKPCNNFYKFACGKFLDNTIIPEDQTLVNTFSMVSDEVLKQLRTIFEEQSNPNEPKAFQLVKGFYRSCMNETRIDERGLEPLKKLLEKLGGWPVLLGDNWVESNFNWIEAAKRFRDAGLIFSDLISFGFSEDIKNNSRRIITINQPKIELQYWVPDSFNITWLRKIYKSIDPYFAYMLDTAELLGADKERAVYELDKSLEFEQKLYEITESSVELRDKTASYNLMTIHDLKKKFPSVPWLEFINIILNISPNVTENEPVVVKVPSYIIKLEDLLKKTPKRIQANYVMWKAITKFVEKLNHKIKEIKFNYYRIFRWKTKREPRWKECVNTVTNELGIAVSALYVRKHFKKESKKDVDEMVYNIQQEIKKKINWMDEETRKAALEKIDSMGVHTGFLDELLNDTKLEEYYKDLDINPEFYFESWLKIAYFYLENYLSDFKEPVDNNNWKIHSRWSTLVNAYARLGKNEIHIPAATLQGMFFNENRPNYLNYGTIGHIIGHEVIHHLGSQYDKNGNLIDWWQPSTKEKYINLTQCIIDQYSNYTVKELNMKLDGINTQGENIADNGGIKSAYKAYRKWASQHATEPSLPELEKYTPRQMFWISVANFWCTQWRPEYLKSIIDSDAHSPSEFRILGSLSNIPEFSEDFICEDNSNMNPKNKCTVW